MNPINMTRRGFLKRSGSAGMGTAAVVGGLGHLGAATAQAQDDYKALVCILLAGGADSFNMLVPLGNSEYQEYANTRRDLALAQSSLLPLSGTTRNGKSVGLHPAMAPLQSGYEAGRIAFVANTGPLVEPTTPEVLGNGAAKLPLGLYSHSDQIAHWQTGTPDARLPSGWGGRMADLLDYTNSNPNISMSISMAGTNLYQSGTMTQQYTVAPDGAIPQVQGLQGEDVNEERSTAISGIFGNAYDSMLRRAYQGVFNRAQAANAQFSQALGSVSPFTAAFGADPFSQAMQTVARTIAARNQLGMNRQTFLVLYGGWDHHDELLNNQAAMLAPLSAGMAAFQSAVDELGLGNQVTTFTTSDFARTLSSNGRGSDHGWGGNHMVMGGAVRGGQVIGDYPDLALGNPRDTGRGVLLPHISTDEYFAELALWFGIAPSDLDIVLPNVSRFYSPLSGQMPLGFMA
ncbi:MAG: DUF1501 domain-containing protein [Pseudomonadota bacterium]